MSESLQTIATTARIRRGTIEDIGAIRKLYLSVAEQSGGLARIPGEVSADYVRTFVEHSLADGLIFVAEMDGLDGLAGELHAHGDGLHNFLHVLGNLTVAVSPSAQGRGIGRRLFEHLLTDVRQHWPHIQRVELVTQESNQRAQRLYESLGFTREGRMERRIRSPHGGVEADIPMAWLRPAGP
jgi:ribosomal protein S18 acetylase RimI-like enzyme